MPFVKSNYFNMSELLYNALVVMVAELLSQKRNLANVQRKYFNKTELLQCSFCQSSRAILRKIICAKCEVKIL